MFSSDKIKCARCGEKRPPIGYAPLPTELGQKIGAECCQPCWQAWLQKHGWSSHMQVIAT